MEKLDSLMELSSRWFNRFNRGNTRKCDKYYRICSTNVIEILVVLFVHFFLMLTAENFSVWGIVNVAIQEIDGLEQHPTKYEIKWNEVNRTISSDQELDVALFSNHGC